MIHRLLTAVCFLFVQPAVAQTTPPFESSGLELLAHLETDSFTPSLLWGGKCWGYTSPSGREFALLGGFAGTAIVEATDPGRPTQIAVVPGVQSGNRSVRTYQQYAYVTANAGGGIQVLDLSAIEQGSVSLINTVLAGGAEGTHNLAIDEVSGYLYRLGFEAGPGMRFYSLVDPTSPAFVGSWDPSDDHPGNGTVHDAEIVTFTSGPYTGRQIAFACTNGALESMSIVEVTDKANPSLLREAFYPNANGGLSHQLSLSEDRQWVFLNDEFDEKFGGLPSTTYVFDVSDIVFPAYVTSFTNGNSAVTHDAYVKGDRLYAANYTSGLRVFDVSDPLAAVEVAHYDTWPCNDFNTFTSLYGNYPFFPSGTLLGSAIDNGFFMWREGAPEIELDFGAGPPQLLAPSGQAIDVSLTEAAVGTLEPGSAKLWFDAGDGRDSVPLVDQGAGVFRAELPALPCGRQVSLFAAARTVGGTTWTEPPAAFTREERYWSTVASNRTVIFADDFESDLGWTTSGPAGLSGAWERVAPNETPYAPGEDATPGAGTQCWVTDDAPGNCEPLIGEVQGGPFVLTSPVIDLSAATDPRVRYTRWFSNNGSSWRDDVLLVQASSDGADWVIVETIGPKPPDTTGGWRRGQFRVLDHVPLTAAFQVRIAARAATLNSIVEAGLDDFEVFEPDCELTTVYCTAKQTSCGNTPSIGASGTPSATARGGFDVTCSNVPEGALGILIYTGAGQANPPTPFQGGWFCIGSPFKRSSVVLDTTGTPGLCDGTFSIDMNALAQGTGFPIPGPALKVVGNHITCQFWGRDTPTSSMLSDALEYVVGP